MIYTLFCSYKLIYKQNVIMQFVDISRIFVYFNEILIVILLPVEWQHHS